MARRVRRRLAQSAGYSGSLPNPEFKMGRRVCEEAAQYLDKNGLVILQDDGLPLNWEVFLGTDPNSQKRFHFNKMTGEEGTDHPPRGTDVEVLEEWLEEMKDCFTKVIER